MIYITGDPHAKFENIEAFCREQQTTKDDVLIVLRDMAINASTPERAREKKEELKNIPITFFCIHGNHDRRPETLPVYKLRKYRGGKVWAEEEYLQILFAEDGELFDFDGLKAIVIGGAYSANKEERIRTGRSWFPDEQPSEEIRQAVEQKLAENNWKVDLVLSHAVPLKYKPTDQFRYQADPNTIDETTEIWLGEIEKNWNIRNGTPGTSTSNEGSTNSGSCLRI